jgi:gluconate kinase
MKKLKKSQNNKQKFNLVVFYGPFAVGKHTVASEFHKQAGYKFIHNHDTFNVARKLFDRETYGLHNLYEKMNFIIMEGIAEARLNVVTTHAYSANFVSKTGMSDSALMKKIETIIRKKGGQAYFVHLVANREALLKRVSNPGRKKLSKLVDRKVMEGIIKEKENTDDWVKSAPVINNLKIDNSNLLPKDVVKKVREVFKI